MGGKSNIPLLKVETLISKFVKMTGLTQSQASMIIGIIAAIIIIAFLYWFLEQRSEARCVRPAITKI